MLYLVKNNKFTKIGFASNWRERLRDYYTTNPYIQFLGLREGTLNDERSYHQKYIDYIKIPQSEWMILPDNILEELKSEFVIPKDSTFICLNDKLDLKQMLIDNCSDNIIIEKLKSLNAEKFEVNRLLSENKLKIMDIIPNKSKYYYIHPDQKEIDIEKNKIVVQNFIHEHIKEPTLQGEVKEMLQNLYDSLNIIMTANSTDINKIWLPGEYKTKTRTYHNIQGGFVYPKDFKFQGNKKPVKKVDKDGIETFYDSAKEAATNNGFIDSTSIIKRIKSGKPDKFGNFYVYI